MVTLGFRKISKGGVAGNEFSPAVQERYQADNLGFILSIKFKHV